MLIVTYHLWSIITYYIMNEYYSWRISLQDLSDKIAAKKQAQRDGPGKTLSVWEQ